MRLTEVTDEELLHHGGMACPGCGAYLGLRLALKALGKNTILFNVTGCIATTLIMGVTKIPMIHTLFENGPAIASGVDYGLTATGKREGINLLVYAGDGGTADIGLQSLSGAIERGHNFVYICYDNESYMNTGGQRSGTTPFGAITTTTPEGKKIKGETRPIQLRKDMVEIVAAHGTPYVASASIAYPLDFMEKVKKAAETEGPAYIHLFATCPTGWGADPAKTIEIARLAVQTGMINLFEIIDGERKITVRIRKRKPVEEYLKLQRRFKPLLEDKEALKALQDFVDRKCERLGLDAQEG